LAKPHFSTAAFICSAKGFLGYAGPDWQHPENKWAWHNISPDNKYHRFSHGLGFGDVNGDGRKDILEKDGWWEQPANSPPGQPWIRHDYKFADAAASSVLWFGLYWGINPMALYRNWKYQRKLNKALEESQQAGATGAGKEMQDVPV